MAYAEYHKACLAGDLAQILALVASVNRKEFESYSGEMRTMVINFLRDRPARIRIAEPVISGDSASFRIEGLDIAGQKAIGSVKVVTEEGKWKVSEDKWAMSQE